MQSFLAYVAEQYSRKKEDVATDALVYLLKKHSAARTAFRTFVLDKCGYELPEISSDSVASRTKAADGGVPDLQISDEYGICAIVENKFRARLTEKQPVGYFNQLRDGGLILFVVPNDRIEKLWKDLQKLCDDVGRPIEPLPGMKFSGKSAKHRLSVVSWGQLICYLEARLDNDDAQKTESPMFVDQLRRVCEVAKKETFENLTSDQLNGPGTLSLIRPLTWITREVIDRCIANDIAQEIKKKEFQAKIDDDSSLYVGQDLLLSGVKIWIGFWPKVWEERGISPLWLVLYLPESEENLIVKRLKKEQGFEHLKYSDDESGWTIPIPVEPGKVQDDVVDKAFEFVSRIKSAIESGKAAN